MAQSERGQPKGDPVGNYLSPGGDNVKLIYILYLVSVVVGITMLIGLVIAYLNRGAAAGTWAHSHYTYQIRTFWIGLLYSVICIVLMIIGIGFLLILAVLVWGVVRCVRGLQWASAAQPVPNPLSWLV
jgi:uncharacterized membrane protein